MLCALSMWRKGSRAALRALWSQDRVGSSPSIDTQVNAPVVKLEKAPGLDPGDFVGSNPTGGTGTYGRSRSAVSDPLRAAKERF